MLAIFLGWLRSQPEVFWAKTTINACTTGNLLGGTNLLEASIEKDLGGSIAAWVWAASSAVRRS